MVLTEEARRKLVAATVAVGLSLVGIVTGLRWLTVVALLVWVVAMLLIGTGRREATDTNAPVEEKERENASQANDSMVVSKSSNEV